MTAFEEIYGGIKDALTGVGISYSWYDIDIGQLEEEDSVVPILFPAVFVKFDDIIWRNLDDTRQEGLMNLSVKIAFQFTKENELLDPSQPREQLAVFINEIFDIHTTLHNLSGSTFSKLKRFNQFQLKTNPKDLLWVHVLQYQCNIQSDNHIDNPDVLNVYYDEIINNNVFMERKRFNLLQK